MIPDLPAFFRPTELEGWGISRDVLRGMLRRGEVVRLARGLYRVTAAPIHEHETLAAVSKLVPGVVVCLLSALSFHSIGTQLPPAVWIAVPRKARRPKVTGLAVRVILYSQAMMRYGVESHEILGVAVKVTSPARTVVDCFRFRDTVGLDVALEALKDVLGSRSVTVDELQRAAEAVGVEEEIAPYLEAVLA